MGVNADRDIQAGDQRLDPGPGHGRGHRPGGVHAVDHVSPAVLHFPGLLEQLLGLDHVGHHQEADCLQTEFLGHADVLLGDVRFRAVGGDAGDRGAEVGDGAQVLGRADARDQQACDLRGPCCAHRRGDQLQVVGAGKAVIERGSAQSVAVSDFQDRNAGPVEPGHDVGDLLPGVLVTDGVRAVSQRRVSQPEIRRAHAATPVSRWAFASATRTAAAVMMSRLPA